MTDMRHYWVIALVPLLSACDPTVVPPQPAAVASAAPTAVASQPADTVTPSASAASPVSPSPTATPTPKPTPTPPKGPAPSVDGYVYFQQQFDEARPSNVPKLVNVDVVALSKTVGKPYYRQAKASPRFEFTDLPYEAEIEITSAAEGWTRGVTTVMTGTQPIRISVAIPMKTQIYVNVPVQ
jgi:hypothetical protein